MRADARDYAAENQSPIQIASSASRPPVGMCIMHPVGGYVRATGNGVKHIPDKYIAKTIIHVCAGIYSHRRRRCCELSFRKIRARARAPEREREKDERESSQDLSYYIPTSSSAYFNGVAGGFGRLGLSGILSGTCEAISQPRS